MEEAYSSVGDSKEAEEHILITPWRDLRHHGLSICIIWGLEHAKKDVINPEIPDGMVPYSICPHAEHAIERDENTECIGYNEHMLRLETKVLLDVPETERGER